MNTFQGGDAAEFDVWGKYQDEEFGDDGLVGARKAMDIVTQLFFWAQVATLKPFTIAWAHSVGEKEGIRTIIYVGCKRPGVEWTSRYMEVAQDMIRNCDVRMVAWVMEAATLVRPIGEKPDEAFYESMARGERGVEDGVTQNAVLILERPQKPTRLFMAPVIWTPKGDRALGEWHEEPEVQRMSGAMEPTWPSAH